MNLNEKMVEAIESNGENIFGILEMSSDEVNTAANECEAIAVEFAKGFALSILTKMMPDKKEIFPFIGRTIFDAEEFGENKAEQRERLVYLRAISELDQKLTLYKQSLSK